MTTEKPAQPDVLLYVEQAEPSKFKIQSDQLEQIGAKLRGPRRFSVFYSIILPLIVTVVTTLVTAGFQYLSWLNTVRLQAATAVAERADETLEKAANLIGQRSYGTTVFIPSVRDLAKAIEIKQSPPQLSSTDSKEVAQAGTQRAAYFTYDITSAIGNSPLLRTVSDELRKLRFQNYYLQLKNWNEQYDQILADIDFDLDRPISKDAEVPRTAISVYFAKLKDINCRNSLPEELEKAKLDKRSLKIQFAAIHHCFGALHGGLDEKMTGLLNHSIDQIDPTVFSKASDDLNHIKTLTNQFRCVALLRVSYYKQQKEKSIVVPGFVRNWLFDPTKAEADQHFAAEDTSCNRANRPI